MAVKNKFLSLLVILIASFGFAQEEGPATFDELETAVLEVLEDTPTPAAGLAIVDTAGTRWIANLGLADVENDRPADSTTMFRIASVTKMFTSMAVLKLQEEGKLDLNDPVRSHIKEIEFTNRWEDTDPVRIVHLLEHTTGWDDIHLPEFAHNDPTPVTLKEGLDFHPHSRICRWIPGSRMSYCNSGPGVAAYIVEKITGIPFEEFVQQHFFDPLGMRNTTYFYDQQYRQHGATLYNEGEPVAYDHILARPSGSINSTASDMARLVRFFLNRGQVNAEPLLTEASIIRMETPATTNGAAQGLEVGYGLSNFTTGYDGFVFHGHNGGVEGGLTQLAYLPEHGIGYVFMINSGDGDTYKRISELLKAYVTRDLDIQVDIDAIDINHVDSNIEGYYIPVNSRQQMSFFIDRIFNVKRIMLDSADLIREHAISGGNRKRFKPVAENKFAWIRSGKVELVKTTDPLIGEVLHDGNQVLKKTSALAFYGTLTITGLWVILVFGAIVYGIVWLILLVRRKLHRGPALQVRLWPFLAAVSLVLFAFLMFLGLNEPFRYLSSPTFISVGLMLLSIVYALCSIAAFAITIIMSTVVRNRWLLAYSFLTSTVFLVATLYLMYYGVIGMRTWV